MNVQPIIDRLRERGAARFCEEGRLRGIRDHLENVKLPDDHLNVLAAANGILGYAGYVRLFGAGCSSCTDMKWWNDENTWKFAWPTALKRLYCFGETAWGDQYAYDTDALAGGGSRVYFLDAISMEAEQIAGSFEEFFRDEFLRCSIDPYDRRLVTAAQTFGPLDWKEHLVYVPSILITGDETASSVEKMSARASMIVNGDLARQLGHSTFEREMAELEEYTDERGRTRVRVIWAS